MVFALSEVYLGLFDEAWRHCRGLGYYSLVLAPGVALLWQTYPEACAPWGSALMGSAYATLFLVIALSHLNVRTTK